MKKKDLTETDDSNQLFVMFPSDTEDLFLAIKNGD